MPTTAQKRAARLRLARIRETNNMWKWTGFSGKTLWDWLQLLVVPIVLTTLGFFFNIQQAQISDINSARQHMFDQQIALDQQQEATLKTYLDDMASLLLNNKLHESKPEDEVRNVARARTLTVLRRLDPIRKGVLLLFLFESGLIIIGKEGQAIVVLGGADLSGASLSQVNLEGVDLSRANLSQAKLDGTYLYGGYLVEANLSGADLRGAQMDNINLSGANLRRANLNEAYLPGANLAGANLFMANLNEAKLGTGANLNGSDLSRASLSRAFLVGAQLLRANLSGAKLRKANLLGANLSGADLSDADLTGAVVQKVQLEEAKSLQGAIMPNGSIHP